MPCCRLCKEEKVAGAWPWTCLSVIMTLANQQASSLSHFIQKENRSLRASDLAKATQLGSHHAGIRPRQTQAGKLPAFPTWY